MMPDALEDAWSGWTADQSGAGTGLNARFAEACLMRAHGLLPNPGPPPPSQATARPFQPTGPADLAFYRVAGHLVDVGVLHAIGCVLRHGERCRPTNVCRRRRSNPASAVGSVWSCRSDAFASPRCATGRPRRPAPRRAPHDPTLALVCSRAARRPPLAADSLRDSRRARLPHGGGGGARQPAHQVRLCAPRPPRRLQLGPRLGTKEAPGSQLRPLSGL